MKRAPLIILLFAAQLVLLAAGVTQHSIHSGILAGNVSSSSVTSTSTVAVSLGLAQEAEATTTDPASVCQSAKLTASASATRALLRCHSVAAAAGVLVDPTCLATADGGLASSLAKTEARGGCTTVGDEPTIQSRVDTFVANIIPLLRPSQGADTCSAAKIGTVGKLSSKMLSLYGKDKKKPNALLLAKLSSKAHAKFATSFSKAEAAVGCVQLGDESTMESAIDAFVADVTRALYPWSTVSNGSAVLTFPPVLIPAPTSGNSQILTQDTSTSSFDGDALRGTVGITYLDNPTNLSIQDFYNSGPPSSNLSLLAQGGTSSTTLPGGNHFMIFFDIAAFDPYDIYVTQCPNRIVELSNTAIDTPTFRGMLDNFHC